MKFGEVHVAEAEGAILAHSLRLGTTALKKARVLSRVDLDLIAGAGLTRIAVARLEPGDVGEDEAARRVAAAAAGAEIEPAAPFTGRVNLFSRSRGLLVFDRERLDRLNLVNEAITLGTLPPFAVVEPRMMIATVKIIPFAAPAEAVERCVELARTDGPLLRVAPFLPRSVGLVQTRLPGLKESILDKTREVTEGRLKALGCRLLVEERCGHATAELAPLIHDAMGHGIDVLLIHGASAILDRRDVIPAAIVAAGGVIDHFGMPVDPGNLLLLGHVGARAVLGLPGCARSPKVNGFDWVLERLVAGLPVGAGEIMRMGSGGLLAEIPSRPLPRAEATPAAERKPEVKPQGPRIGALLLAAGQSRRMGGPNKLLAAIDGVPMVAHVARRLLASRARPIIAVLGNQAEAVDAALGKLPVERIRNPEFAAGLSTSLKRGVAALAPDLDGVIVCLGDMPLISGRHLDRLIAAFNPLEGRAIIVPTRRGKRGNPVLWSKRFLPEMAELAGDVGAKHLIGEHADLVAEVEMDDDAVLVDIDTPEALNAFQEKRKPSPRPNPPPLAGEGTGGLDKGRTEEKMETTPFRAYQAGTQPPYDAPAYGSTQKRHPQEGLVRLPHTITEISGPLFIAAQSPPIADLSVVDGKAALGERIIVHGRITDEDGRPVPHTIVEIWQANAAGRYHHPSDQHDAPTDPNFRGEGRVYTDEEGWYRLTSIKPGAYPWRNHHNAWRPNHIHFSFFGSGFAQRLVTQMYFPGDPLLDLDPVFLSIPDQAARNRLVCQLDMNVTKPEWALGYRWDVVLRGRAATPIESASGGLTSSRRSTGTPPER